MTDQPQQEMPTRVARADTDGRFKRNAKWRSLVFRGASYSAVARLYGVSHATVMYALDPEYRARKQTKMFLYNNARAMKAKTEVCR